VPVYPIINRERRTIVTVYSRREVESEYPCLLAQRT
jgi:hypothetical protein